MKKLIVPILLLIVLISCKSTSASTAMSNFSDISGKDWKLIEVRVGGKNIEFDRRSLSREGFSEIFAFTFSLRNEEISGVGAPNRYTAPYTLEEGNKITIGLVRATLMAAITEPEKLREHDYFSYIQNVYEWKVEAGKLELLSQNTAGTDVVLIFSL